MIITRAPFRVSFCGGGSDLPSFYEKYGGCVLSTTIRKYMYLTIHNYFYKDQIVLKYSKTTSNPIAIASNKIYVTGELPTTGETVPDVPFPNLGSG